MMAVKNQRETQERPGRLWAKLSFVSGALLGWLYVKPGVRGLTSNLIGYGLKIIGAAFSPVLVLVGTVSAWLTARSGRITASWVGGVASLLGAYLIRRVTAPQANHRLADTRSASGAPRGQGSRSGADLTRRGSEGQGAVVPWQARMLKHRWFPGQVATYPRPAMLRDLAFATVPGTQRELLCDLWLPAPEVPRSGLGVIYLHGGAWQSFDKDVMTRPFFRHLTAQGHVVMDVAYRLARETDMRGMLGDVKRAVAWMKQNSGALGISPERVILSGGSAGGHLALLAGFTPNGRDMEPTDVQDVDTSVRGVVAYYPVTDLRTLNTYWSEQSMHPIATALGRMLGYLPREGYLTWSKLVHKLFGGPLGKIDQELLRFSPIAHVGPHCPPTLIVQGLHDHVIPVADVFALHAALRAAGCSADLVTLPQIEHAFDMVGLQISPPAQAALYEVDRFLALLI